MQEITDVKLNQGHPLRKRKLVFLATQFSKIVRLAYHGKQTGSFHGKPARRLSGFQFLIISRYSIFSQIAVLIELTDIYFFLFRIALTLIEMIF